MVGINPMCTASACAACHRGERIGIPKPFLRPRERIPWSPPAFSPPATLRHGDSRAPRTAREPRRNAPAPGGARRCVAVAGAGQAPQDGGGERCRGALGRRPWKGRLGRLGGGKISNGISKALQA